MRTPSLRILLVAALALTACRHVQLPENMDFKPLSFRVRDVRFPSGLRVIAEEDHRAPLVSVVMLVGSGAT